VHPYPFGVGDIVPAVDLPKSSHARRHPQQIAAVFSVVFQFLRNNRPWADKAHFAHEDIPQLGQFIQTGAAENSPHAGNPRIVAKLKFRLKLGPRCWVLLEILGQALLGIGDHGTEFEYVKRDPSETKTFLTEEYRSG